MGVCLRSPIYIYLYHNMTKNTTGVISRFLCTSIQLCRVRTWMWTSWTARMGMAGNRPSSKILPVASSCLLVALSLIFLPPTAAHLPQERDYSLVVDAGKEECFFEEVVKGNTLTVEYQVRPARSGQDLSSINMFSSLSGVRWRGWDDVRAGHQLQVALPSRSSACCRVQEVRRDA